MSEVTQPPGAMDRTLSAEQLDLALCGLDALPTFPSVARRVLALTSGRAAEPASACEEELTDLLRLDVSLTARLLSLANQGGVGPVGTVRHAAAALGPQALRSAVLCTPVLPAERLSPDAAAGLDYPEFWRHCLAVAVAAEALVRRTGAAIDPDEAFACGLLHDLGKLALDTQMPKTYRRVLEAARLHMADIAAYERKIVGVDHAVVGRRLAERWHLPRAMQQVLWLAHQPAEAIPASVGAAERLLIGAVSLADTIAREQRLGFSGNFTFPRPSGQLAGELGLGQEILADVASALAAEVDARYRRLDLKPGAEPLDYRFLIEANAELGRLNDELRRRAEALTGQAEAFGHFCEFAGGLGAEATVGQVLVRIAEGIASAGRLAPSPAEPIVVYSVGGEDAGVLAVRYDGSDRPLWRTFDRGAADESPAAPDPAAPADEVLARLLQDAGELGDWVDLSACVHHPLVSAGSWVGGVLYRAPRRAGAGRDPTRQAVDTLAAAFSLALSMAQARARAMRLGEQLAGASQLLAATQDALAEAKTLAAMGEMAAGAAHELNTPLAVISGRAQLMRERAASQDDRVTWQLVADQAQRVSDIISDLMDFASPPEPTPQAVDIGELLARAVQSFRSCEPAKAADARVDIQLGQDVPPAWADPRQVQAVIEELLMNAAAAAGPQPQIRLSAEADEVNGAVLLTVRDNGPGMDPKTLDSAFTPFFSAQRAGRRCGLGLPRAKRYVEKNGGRIWIRTQPGEGTTVYVQLPCPRSGGQRRE